MIGQYLKEFLCQNIDGKKDNYMIFCSAELIEKSRAFTRKCKFKSYPQSQYCGFWNIG